MIVVGIDENGLAPRLGMFCVTAVAFRCKKYTPQSFWKEFENLRIVDSKLMISSGKTRKGKFAVLEFLRIYKNFVPKSWNEFLSEVSFSKLDDLRKNCGQKNFCWIYDEEINFKTEKSRVLSKKKFLDVKVNFVCPKIFNSAIKRTDNKLAFEIEILEKFFKFFLNRYREKILFLCGKIGGTKKYEKFFKFLSSFKILEKKEREDSIYVFKNFEVRFIKSAEGKHFPIALASVFGKVVREIFIERMNKFFQQHLPNLPFASGYHDRNTSRFIKEALLVLKNEGIPEDCFLRKK
ncbi:MAG: hypothetical protein J7L42_03905 [Elusimicrobia bacterium]|nr:hypothetical protein [Elusimicrobiota bacterium]